MWAVAVWLEHCGCNIFFFAGGGKQTWRRVGWSRLIVGFQPLMVISPTASWIRWRMQVYAWCNVYLSCLGGPNKTGPHGGTIYARQFLGAKLPIQFRHCDRWVERNHSDHSYWLRAAQSDAVFGVTRSGIEPPPPASREDALATMLLGGCQTNMKFLQVIVHWLERVQMFRWRSLYILLLPSLGKRETTEGGCNTFHWRASLLQK